MIFLKSLSFLTFPILYERFILSWTIFLKVVNVLLSNKLLHSTFLKKS